MEQLSCSDCTDKIGRKVAKGKGGPDIVGEGIGMIYIAWLEETENMVFILHYFPKKHKN